MLCLTDLAGASASLEEACRNEDWGLGTAILERILSLYQKTNQSMLDWFRSGGQLGRDEFLSLASSAG